MIAALLIRIASLSLPKKIRQTYLRAWLAELQDAKEDGEGWAFAYDLLVNMGSLKKAAQGEDILYRNRSKTPLWLSMGSLGTVVLATVVAVSFWNGLKTPATTFGSSSPSRDTIIVAQENDSQALKAIGVADSQATSSQTSDLQAITADDTSSGVGANFAARAAQPSPVIQTPQQTFAEATPSIAEEMIVETVEETPETETEITETEITETEITETEITETEITETVTTTQATSNTSGVTIEESNSIESTGNLITPRIAAPAPSIANNATQEMDISATAGMVSNAITETNETTAIADNTGTIEETETVISPLALGTTQNTALAQPEPTTNPETSEAQITTNPVIPVQPVGTPGQAGIPNIPGTDSMDQNTQTESTDALVLAPPPVQPVAANIQPAQGIAFGVQLATPETEATATTPSTFQQPEDIDTTVVIRESIVERPDISEDLQTFRQQLNAGTNAGINPVPVPFEGSTDDALIVELETIEEALNTLSMDTPMDTFSENTNETPSANNTPELLLQGSSDTEILTGVSAAIAPNQAENIAIANNPITEISDEDIQILIHEFLTTGDLSFENSAELITKLAEKLGLGEEEIRELLLALVGRLEP